MNTRTDEFGVEIVRVNLAGKQETKGLKPDRRVAVIKARDAFRGAFRAEASVFQDLEDGPAQRKVEGIAQKRVEHACQIIVNNDNDKRVEHSCVLRWENSLKRRKHVSGIAHWGWRGDASSVSADSTARIHASAKKTGIAHKQFPPACETYL